MRNLKKPYTQRSQPARTLTLQRCISAKLPSNSACAKHKKNHPQPNAFRHKPSQGPAILSGKRACVQLFLQHRCAACLATQLQDRPPYKKESAAAPNPMTQALPATLHLKWSPSLLLLQSECAACVTTQLFNSRARNHTTCCTAPHVWFTRSYFRKPSAAEPLYAKANPRACNTIWQRSLCTAIAAT
jgi:hypothetical protein